jgi:ABC-type Na+ efflux pump permease subunit
MWTVAKKEFLLLIRDRRAILLLLVMPLLFILILGLLLGEGFGQKPDDRTRVSIVDLDPGPGFRPGESWAQVVQRDLAETAGIRLEIINSREEAQRLIDEHKRPAVLIFEPTFSAQVTRCSFLADGINPFHRDGVYLEKVHATLLKDTKQPGGSAIIEQVAQVTLLRVILPWMIGRAFERLSDPAFIEILGEKVRLPVPKAWRLLVGADRLSLNKMLAMAAGGDKKASLEYQEKVGAGVKIALQDQFSKYKLAGRTWADLTKSTDPPREGAEVSSFKERGGSGLLRRGAARYQLLVPSYAVMFAFFLVLTVGWLFVSERREGTMKRLRAAPVTHGQILLGKLIPCFIISLAQGMFLLIAGKLLFGMRWGPDQWSLLHQLAWLLPVVFCTSVAAMGLALLVASLARTEIQVALYGAVPVLVLALIGGCVLPREMMPEQTQSLTLITPQGWALDAYREVLVADESSVPNGAIVARACFVLLLFGTGFLALAWAFLRLDD